MFLSCAANQTDKCRNSNACVIFLLFGIYLSKWGDDVISQERCDKCEDKSSLNKGRLMCCSKMELLYMLFTQKAYEKWTNGAVRQSADDIQNIEINSWWCMKHWKTRWYPYWLHCSFISMWLSSSECIIAFALLIVFQIGSSGWQGVKELGNFPLTIN